MKVKISIPPVLALAILQTGNPLNPAIGHSVEQGSTSMHPLTESYATKQTSRIRLKENDLNIFTVTTVGDDRNIEAVVSLSDLYQDTLAMPPKYTANQKSIPFDDLKFFELDSTSRQRVLTGTNLSERDTMFIYDYQSGDFTKIPVKELKAVAHLTPYASQGEEVSPWDYMIGFELAHAVLPKSRERYYNTVLVYIGKKNPFVQAKLQLIKWEKIEERDFPKKMQKNEYNHAADKISNYYRFKSDTVTFFIRDVLVENRLEIRYFIVAKGKRILVEKIFQESEGSSLAPLNFEDEVQASSGEQWTGYLFNDKPAVIFGFEYHSFGCASIMYVDKRYGEVPINCDNRH